MAGRGQKIRCSKMTKHALFSDVGETAIPRAPEPGDGSAFRRSFRACLGRTILPLAALVFLAVLESAAGADEFILKNGGRVEGELVNRDQSPRTTYVVRDKNGHTITLDADQVRNIKVPSEAERNYERFLPKMPNTAEGNWKMAEWCGRQKLREKEQLHLAEVIRLDPDHALARRRLGYSRLNGKWVKPDEFRRGQGYEPFGGRYRVRQDIQSIQQRETRELAEKQWKGKILGIRNRKRKSRSLAPARQELMAITDPTVVPALIEMLVDEESQSFTSLWIATLGRFPGSAVDAALVQCALHDTNEETRLQCLDQLQRRQNTQATDTFVRALKSNDNRHINRAAAGLQRMQDPYAIPHLIDALTSKHVRQTQSNPGQIGAYFPSGGRGSGGLGGLTMGSRAKRVEVIVENRSVLEALVSMSDGPNFGYDKSRWKQWYINTNTPADVNLRRSD